MNERVRRFLGEWEACYRLGTVASLATEEQIAALNLYAEWLLTDVIAERVPAPVVEKPATVKQPRPRKAGLKK